MAGLVVFGVISAVFAAWAVDRVLKARTQARRLRAMRERLAAAAARAERQHEQRQAEARASAALTSFRPAIKRPPLALPGLRLTREDEDGPGREPSGQPEF
jgi:hypothetical protein